jgi:O-antigen ligase
VASLAPPPVVSAPRGLAKLLTALLILWGLGTAASEGLMQVAADATILFALCLWVSGRGALSRGLRPPVVAGVVLASYQALSPVLARLAGAPGWPPLGRWLQCLDTAAAPALAVGAVVGVWWVAVEVAVVAGWTGSVAVGLVQHLFRWEAPLPTLLRLPVGRVHEVFNSEGPPRFAAGGFFFHRLRFAHGAVALLGPALSASLRAASVSRRWWAAFLSLLCALAIYLSFARAALVAAVLLVVAAVVALSRGWTRRAGVAGVLLLLLAVALAPGWRLRLADAGENLFDGERAEARAAGWDLVHRHWLVGVGFGNYYGAAMARSTDTAIPAQLARDAHAVWLTTWAETGLLGLLLWVAWQALLARALWQRARAGAWPAAGALLSWGAFQALGLAHYLPFHSSVHLTFALVWGVGLVYPGGGLNSVPGGRPAPSSARTPPS